MPHFKKLSHTLYNCKYHVVWCPKYRFKEMRGDIRLYVRDVLRRLCEWKKLEIFAGNVCKDHIHLVLEIPPYVSVSSTIGYLKGRSAVKIFGKFFGLRKKYWGMHYWSKGYCVSTVGLTEADVVEYVREQQEADKKIEQLNMFKSPL